MHYTRLLPAIAFVAASAAGAGAEITSVTGPASTLGAPPAIIAAPADALNGCVTGNGQIGVNEAQGMVTPLAFQADDGVIIPKETLIDSHLIFFHHAHPDLARHEGVVWTFKHPIIAVMSSRDGGLAAASTFALGARKTGDAGSPSSRTPACTGAALFDLRGLKSTDSMAPYAHTNCPSSDDCYAIAGNALKVNMSVSRPGEWIRVITQGAFKVTVDIQPGGAASCIHGNGHEVIPVAILGNAAFDATQIDPSSLDLDGLRVRKSNGKRPCARSDINGDGFDDMVCQFQEDAKNWHGADGTAHVTGALLDGNLFEGADSICLVP